MKAIVVACELVDRLSGQIERLADGMQAPFMRVSVVISIKDINKAGLKIGGIADLSERHE